MNDNPKEESDRLIVQVSIDVCRIISSVKFCTMSCDCNSDPRRQITKQKSGGLKKKCRMSEQIPSSILALPYMGSFL